MNKQWESAMPGDYQGSDGHEHFRSQLPPFAMACLQGDPSSLEWNPLETHLDGCSACRQELGDLLQLLDDMYTGALAPEAAIPVPDLSYLPPWSTSTDARDLVAVVHMVRAAIFQVLIQFNEMLIIAMRQLEPAGEFRSLGPEAENNSFYEGQAPPKGYRYQLQGAAPDDLVVAVDFALTDVERQLYRVKITVIDQDQDPFSQDGHRVTVHYEAQSNESFTDATGCASFHSIPYAALPQLQITINLRSPT